MKKENAITLISLVITIIILLILAGVTISLTLGEGGIFLLAQNASKNYMNEQDKEMSDLENLYSQIKIATNDDAKITISMKDLKTLIKKEANSVSPAPEGEVICLDKDFIGAGFKTLIAPDDGWVILYAQSSGGRIEMV